MTSNYEITKKRVEAEFSGYDHEKIAKKLDLKIDKDYVYIIFLGSEYRVNRISGLTEKITSPNTFEEADFNTVLTIYDILCDSKEGASPSGEYTFINNLSKVQNAASYAGEGFFKQHEDYFAQHMDRLEKNCLRIGGIPFGKGDISYKIPVFKDLCIVVAFWEADEDFPPQLQIKPDTNTLDYMRYETIWYMAGCLVAELRK